LAGAAALLELDSAGIVSRAALALFGVAVNPVCLRAAAETLRGKPIDAGLIQTAATAAKLIEPISDIHASAEYRRHLAQVLSIRALTDAARRSGVEVEQSLERFVHG
jgi:carbon-monoxide dehydrogenase medium subunit